MKRGPAQNGSAAQRRKRLAADWKSVSKIAVTDAMNRATRIRALKTFLLNYPEHNEHLIEARRYLNALETGNEPTIATNVEMVEVAPLARSSWVATSSSTTECEYHEKSDQPDVFVDAFRIDKTEVTVAAYKRCVESGLCDEASLVRTSRRSDACKYARSDRHDHPMNCVTWADADRYCRAAVKLLPTEAEWEKFARGITGSHVFMGQHASRSCRYAVMSGCTGSTWPVGRKPDGCLTIRSLGTCWA